MWEGGQVVEWVLGPVRATWTALQWQQRLASMDNFLACFLPLQQVPDGSVQVGAGRSCMPGMRSHACNHAGVVVIDSCAIGGHGIACSVARRL